jgi:hypothetical protein
MRAKIKDAHSSEVTVGSDLGFLQVGKQLELEDAQSGSKRPANIDRVEVAVDPASHVPQLVVTLRYADVEGDADAARSDAPEAESGPARGGSPETDEALARVRAASAHADDAHPRVRTPSGHADDMDAVEEASIQMKGTVARSIAKIGPAFERFTKRAKTTIALLAARRSLRGDDSAMPRRTTAPAPGGGLHTAGRRVVRGEPGAPAEEGNMEAKPKITKRKAIIAGSVMAVAILGAIALKKSHGDTPASGSTAAPHETTAAAPATTVAELPPPPVTPNPFAAPAAGGDEPGGSFGGSAGASGAFAGGGDEIEPGGKNAHRKHGKATPFGNGPVRHGNVLHLKMDGPIDSIEGAQQPTGFAVKIPGRKSLEAAGPLASRDSRIAGIKVSNDTAGAELTVSFKDGVPNYQVSGKGDTLVISLAPPGSTIAKSEAKGSHATKHHKHGHSH